MGATVEEQNCIVLPAGIDGIPQNAIVLFWSGGKDSYLALMALQETASNIVLCTTFANGMVGHQEIPVEMIKRQAKHLHLPLILIALKSDQRYEERVLNTLLPFQPRSFAFGDLHLEGIRAWREQYFADVPLLFPIWKTEYPDLLERLMLADGTAFISAIGDHFPAHYPLQIGDEYTKELANDFERLGGRCFW